MMSGRALGAGGVQMSLRVSAIQIGEEENLRNPKSAHRGLCTLALLLLKHFRSQSVTSYSANIPMLVLELISINEEGLP